MSIGIYEFISTNATESGYNMSWVIDFNNRKAYAVDHNLGYCPRRYIYDEFNSGLTPDQDVEGFYVLHEWPDTAWERKKLNELEFFMKII